MGFFVTITKAHKVIASDDKSKSSHFEFICERDIEMNFLPTVDMVIFDEDYRVVVKQVSHSPSKCNLILVICKSTIISKPRSELNLTRLRNSLLEKGWDIVKERGCL